MLRNVRSLVILLVTLATLSVAVAWQQKGHETDTAEHILPVLRDNGPKYWKGNLHTHSFWSDGDDFPEMIADWYRRHGYHFLTLSDHNVLSDGERWLDLNPEKGNRALALKKYLARFGASWVEQRDLDGKKQVRLKPLAEFRSLLEEPGRFLLIPGEEITHRFAKLPVHMNGINLRDAIKPINGDNVTETVRVNLRMVAEQSKKTGWRTVTFLNHPNFGWGLRAEDLMLAEELRFFEVFNGHPGVRNYGDELHAGCEKMWDIALALRLGKYRLPLLHGLATDDAHGYHVFGVGKVNPGRGWIMVKAPYLSAEAMVRAIDVGDFYATSGVTLKDVRRDGEKLVVAIQGEKGVTYKTHFIATLRGTSLESQPRLNKDGKPLNVTQQYSPDIGKVVAETDALEATYRLTGQEWYVRAKVISSRPHPNPYQKGDVEVAWTQPVTP